MLVYASMADTNDPRNYTLGDTNLKKVEVLKKGKKQ